MVRVRVRVNNGISGTKGGLPCMPLRDTGELKRASNRQRRRERHKAVACVDLFDLRLILWWLLCGCGAAKPVFPSLPTRVFVGPAWLGRDV